MKIKLLFTPRFEIDIGDGRPMNIPMLAPLGIAMLTAYLRKHGIDADQDDLMVLTDHHNREAKLSEKIDLLAFEDKERLTRFIEQRGDEALESEAQKILDLTHVSGYDIVGLSVYETHAISAVGVALVLAKILKTRYGSTVIVGGHAHGEVHGKLLSGGWVDYIFPQAGIGSVCTNLLNFCRRYADNLPIEKSEGIIFHRNGKRIENPSAGRKDFFIRPTFDGLPLDLYRRPYPAKEGDVPLPDDILILPYLFVSNCPNGCPFCNNSVQPDWGSLDPEEVAADLEQLSHTYRTSYFFFLNSGINPTYQYADQVADAIIDRGLRLHWTDCATFQRMDVPLLRKLRRAGATRLIFGLESMSPALSRLTGKRTRPGVTKLLEEACRLGIWSEIELICGLPHETEEDVQQTLDFIRDNVDYIQERNIFKFWLDGLIKEHPQRYDIELIHENHPEAFALEGNQIPFDEVGGLPWHEKVLVTNDRFQRMCRFMEDDFPPSKNAKPPSSMTEEDLFMIRTIQSWNDPINFHKVREVLRDVGVRHLDSGERKVVKEYLTRALAVKPGLDWAHYHLGIVCERSGDTKGATVHYLETLTINEDSENCLMAVNRLSALSLAEGDLSSAQAWLERGEPFYEHVGLGSKAELEYGWSRFFHEEGDQEKELTHLRTAVGLAPNREAYWMEFLGVLGERDRCEGLLGEILMGVAAEKIEDLAWMVGRLERGESLVERLEDEAERSEGERAWRLLYLVARYWKNGGESGRALELYRRCIDSGGDGVGEVLRDIGECHLDIGEVIVAKEYLARALAVKPGLDWAHYHLGIVCERSGDTKGARVHYLETLTINEDSENCLMAVNRLSALSLAEGDLSSAQAWLERGASFREPEDSDSNAARRAWLAVIPKDMKRE